MSRNKERSMSAPLRITRPGRGVRKVAREGGEDFKEYLVGQLAMA